MESRRPALSRPARRSRAAPEQCCARAANGRTFSLPARRRLCVRASVKRSECPRRYSMQRVANRCRKIVMRDAICADFLARAIKRLLAFADSKYFCVQRFASALAAHSLKQCASIGNQRHTTHRPNSLCRFPASPRTTISPASKSTSRHVDLARFTFAATGECQARAAKSAQFANTGCGPRASPHRQALNLSIARQRDLFRAHWQRVSQSPRDCCKRRQLPLRRREHAEAPRSCCCSVSAMQFCVTLAPILCNRLCVILRISVSFSPGQLFSSAARI